MINEEDKKIVREVYAAIRELNNCLDKASEAGIEIEMSQFSTIGLINDHITCGAATRTYTEHVTT